jgi:hypothetical protein
MSENLEAVLKELPASVKDEVAKLPEKNQELFVQVYRKKKKSLLMAFLLCLLYGTHNVYLEKTDLAFWFWLTGGGLVVWWIIEFFRVPGMVREFNRAASRVVLAEVRTAKQQPRI